jgi:hypothetical protein
MLLGMRFVSTRSFRSVLVATLIVVLGVAANGQRPQGGGGTGTSTPLLIDFNALTADGKPVVDLTPADLTVRVGGKARTVSSLELKKVAAADAAAPAAPAAAPAAAAITPPFFTNEAKAAAGPALGRSFLIVVDTESLAIGTEASLKAAIETLLNSVTSADRVGLATAPNDQFQMGLGTPIARVREGVASIKGQRAPNVTAADALCRTHNTLALLKSMMTSLAGSETPISLVYIAQSLSLPGKDTGADKNQLCEVLANEYSDLANVAAEARANVYVVQGDTSTLGRDAGLDQLAGATGGGAVGRVAGDGFAARVLAESSTYWIATLAPDATDRPGQAQRLELKANRDGVTIRSRQAAVVSRVTPGAGQAAQAKPGTTSPKEMVASTAAFTDLPLRAAAIVQRGAEDKYNILVQAEPVDPAVKINAMRVGYFDQATNKGASLDSPKAASYPITTAFAVPAGQYRVRVAATDESGKSGAVDVTLNVGFTSAGPLKVSSLMIGAPQGASGLRPQLTFSTEEQVIVFLQIYGQLSAGISVKFEVAKSDTGPALSTYPPAGGGPTNEPDKLQVFGQIPIAKLEPGDYVIRAVVQMEGQPEGKALKTFRKVAK